MNGRGAVLFTKSNGFTVVSGGAADVWVDFIGSANLRAGGNQTYYVLVGNRGSVDSSSVTAWVGYPVFLTPMLQPGQGSR